ncbi:winged helix-turn-helix transcriptional regulator [Streptomyces sp. NPDC015345]|uniref:winged helix-turn-helix transcriptional regulator n=1 Tax=Streptomyces sp. NPDC015345 TaxID=3364953 RepID=UPI0036FCCB89
MRPSYAGVMRRTSFANWPCSIARNTLTDRLRRLVDEGLLEKRAYQRDPMRYDYVLTEKGRDFFGVLAAMSSWGDRWLSGDEGAPVVFHHDRCGHDSHAEVVCADCKEPMTASNTTARLGPGYPPHLAERPDVRARFDA